MANAEAVGRLRTFLDERLFQPILAADPQGVEAGERAAFEVLQEQFSDRRQSLWSCRSAEDLVDAFTRFWHADEAVEARRGLARVGLPVPISVWDDFVALAGQFGLRPGAERDPLPELQPQAEERIAARARTLWEQDGRPAGRKAEYFERARELEAIADHPEAGVLPNPMTQADQRPSAEQVEEAVENQADVPGFLTDQGERPAEPTHDAVKSKR